MEIIKTKEIWIKEGYKVFAIHGEKGLKIESLAKVVGINKSSFYHYFVDLEIFIDQLLEYHLFQSKIIADKENKAEYIDPELIEILIEHKIDLLFNRQLRINQNNQNYLKTLQISNKIIGNVFINIWVKDHKLTLKNNQMEGLFELAIENFFLQINDDNLNYNWLKVYFNNLKEIALTFV